MQRQYVHVNDRTIAYFDSSPGDRSCSVVVLIHAFPLGAAMWEGQTRALPPGWRLLAPDVRGFGGSTLPDPDNAPSIDDYAVDVIDLLRELGVSSAVVGGLSMGGYVVFAVLRQAPQLARAIVLADTKAGGDSLEGRANRRSMLALLEREGPSGVAREMMPKLLGKTSREERQDLEPFVRQLIKQQSAAAVRGAILRMMDRPDSFAVLTALTVPTLIIAGDEDDLTPVDESQKMLAATPHGSLVVLPRTGHLSNLEQRDAFNSTVCDFLSRL